MTIHRNESEGHLNASALFCVLLLSVSGVPQQATSPSFSGVRDSANIFLAKCNSEHVTSRDELSAQTFCQGYITGLSDGVEMTMMAVAPGCPPEHLTPAQMGRIALKYMQEHPEQTHTLTPVLMFEAWAAAFPCPTKK
jgi:hypothetical protein